MTTIYEHLINCWYTRKDILAMDLDTILKIDNQSFLQRLLNKY